MRAAQLLLASAAVGLALATAARADGRSDGFQSPPAEALAGRRAQVGTSPGFSHTGDAAVQPPEAMKKLAWSATQVAGGQPFTGRLAPPPDNSGPFQNIAYGDQSPWTHGMDRAFYRDVAVIAYRRALAPPPDGAVITSSGGPIEAARMTANDPAQPFQLASPGRTAWVRFDFPQARTIRSAVLATPEVRIDTPMVVTLQAGDGRGRFRTIATLDMRSSGHATVSFAPVTARSFRFAFARRPLSFEPIVPSGGPEVQVSAGAIDFFKKMRSPLPTFPILSLALSAEGRVNEFERKAGFFTYVNDYYALATPTAAAAPVPKADVIDLTGRMRPDGTLDWTPPPGNWEVLRLGYSLTGAYNHPAPPDQTGLEVDKLDAGQMRRYLNRHLDGALRRGKVEWLFADSIEAGPQNWTDALLAEFLARRGYNPKPYLPALTGVVVESAAATDRFLWDYRQTLAELLSENTFGVISEVAHARGLKVSAEALETGRHTFGDDFEMRRYADLPVGALWGSAPLVDYLRDYPNQVADQRGAASVAHIYGRPLVGAESGTDLEHPGVFSARALKPMVDLEFAFGVNQMTRGGPGPQEPWAAYGEDWARYLARTGWMLQQGRYVADVAYFFGQEAPLVSLRERLGDTPKEYGFDFVNAEALLHAMVVKDGRLVAPSGLSYRVLQLGGSSRMMTVPVLRRIKGLLGAGAVVVGPAPTDTPSLADDPAEFRRLRLELWGASGRGGPFGHGRLYGAASIDQALAAEGATPDLTAHPGRAGVDVLFVHRALEDGALYYVVSRSPRGGPAELSFRQTGRAPELWRADTGERTPLPYRIERGRTVVPVVFRPHDAVFVVFQKSTLERSRSPPPMRRETVARIEGPWQVAFPGPRGAPGKSVAIAAGSWAASADPAVKYFSGTATYTREVDVPAIAVGKGRVILDLGEVRDLADVRLNGRSVGVRWSPPYRFDITDAVKAGANRIEVKVVDLAVNAMIGARQPGAAPAGPGGGFGLVEYRPDAPLAPSGLIGPVSVALER